MSKPNASLSATKKIYLTLRQLILDMNMLPGERINEREIAETHGVSRTPAHEAVQLLTEEGLIEVIPRVGTFVARIPLDQQEEATLVRRALESMVIEHVAGKISPADVARLREILVAQYASIVNDDLLEFHRQDEAFHEALSDIAGFQSVWKMITQIKIQVDRYRRLTLPIPGRMEANLTEHRAVVDALSEGNATAALAALQTHLDNVMPGESVADKFPGNYFIRSSKSGSSL
ncbi:MAG: GntR family transcriptional regulator [Iodobacter sp.]